MSATPARQLPFTPRRLAWLRPPLRLLFGLLLGYRSTGREHLPPGPAILASNHQSYLDPIFVDLGQERGVCFMAWHALFTVPLLAPAIRWLAAFPVNTEGEDIRAYRMALTALAAGHRLVIFPEGERSFDGRLLPLREGVATLAMHAGVPIVPVRLEGLNRVWPKGRWPRLARPVRVIYGPPIYPPDKKLPTDQRREAVRSMLDRLADHLGTASGPPVAARPMSDTVGTK